MQHVQVFISARKSSQHLLLVLLPPCTLQGCQKTRIADESNKNTGNFPLLFPFIVLNGFHWKMTKERLKEELTNG